MTNCRIINNTASSDGGVVKAVNGSLQMSNCLVFNNIAGSNGGVVFSSGSTIVITNCTFKRNSALGFGGVFLVGGGTTFLRNSSFVKNFAGLDGGVFFIIQHSVINITQSRCVGNRANHIGGVLVSGYGTKTLISDTEFSQNSGAVVAVILTDENSVLELNGSQVVNNNAHNNFGVLYISNNSLFVAFNSSFKGNKDSALVIKTSTAYLENKLYGE